MITLIDTFPSPPKLYALNVNVRLFYELVNGPYPAQGTLKTGDCVETVFRGVTRITPGTARAGIYALALHNTKQHRCRMALKREKHALGTYRAAVPRAKITHFQFALNALDFASSQGKTRLQNSPKADGKSII